MSVCYSLNKLVSSTHVLRDPKYKSYHEHLNAFEKSVMCKQERRNKQVEISRNLLPYYNGSLGHRRRDLYFVEEARGIYSLQFSSDGKEFAIGFGNGSLTVYNYQSSEGTYNLLKGTSTGYPITCIKYNPIIKRIFYAASGQGSVLMCSIHRNMLDEVIYEENNEINALDIDNESKRIITGGSDASIRLYDAKTLQNVGFYTGDFCVSGGNEETSKHSKRLFAVRFKPDNNSIFLSGGWDNMVKIWDDRVPYDCVLTIFGPHIAGDSIDTYDNEIVTASWTPVDPVRLWDIRTGCCLDSISLERNLKRNQGYFALGLQYFKGDPSHDLVLVSSMGHKSADVVSLKHKFMLHSFVSDQTVVTADSFMNKIVYGGTDSVLHETEFYPEYSSAENDDPEVRDSTFNLDFFLPSNDAE